MAKTEANLQNLWNVATNCHSPRPVGKMFFSCSVRERNVSSWCHLPINHSYVSPRCFLNGLSLCLLHSDRRLHAALWALSVLPPRCRGFPAVQCTSRLCCSSLIRPSRSLLPNGSFDHLSDESSISRMCVTRNRSPSSRRSWRVIEVEIMSFVGDCMDIGVRRASRGDTSHPVVHVFDACIVRFSWVGHPCLSHLHMCHHVQMQEEPDERIQ